MRIKVAINGFGRIGRPFFRLAFGDISRKNTVQREYCDDHADQTDQRTRQKHRQNHHDELQHDQRVRKLIHAVAPNHKPAYTLFESIPE